MWLNLERTVDKRVKKTVITLQTAMTKKDVSFFSEKIGVTPSVAAQGDSNPSDATGSDLTMFTFKLTPTVLRSGKLWYQFVDEQRQHFDSISSTDTHSYAEQWR